MKKTFTWLHLTDLHWGAKGHKVYWPNIEEQLFVDIEKLSQRENVRLDAVFFTGDIVFKGALDEYQGVCSFFEKLRLKLKELGSLPALFSVPGNHDLVRLNRRRVFIKKIIENSESAVDEILNAKKNSHILKGINETFGNYKTQFQDVILQKWNRENVRFDTSTAMIPGDFVSTMQVDGIKVGILGMNSSFIQLTGDNYKGKVAVTLHQLESLLGDTYYNWFKEHQICFLLTHHPYEWLSDSWKDQFFREIVGHNRFALHMCGHLHEGDMAETQHQASLEKYRTFVSGSLYGDLPYKRWAEGEAEPQKMKDRTHGYCMGTILFDGPSATMRLFPRYSPKRRSMGWSFVRDSHRFKLEENGGTTPISIQMNRTIGDEQDQQEDVEADEKIKDHALEICQEIIKELERSVMVLFTKMLREAIDNKSGKDTFADQIKWLCSISVLQAIEILHEATKESLKDLEQSGTAEDLIQKVKEGAENLLGWIVLLTIDDGWLQRNYNSFVHGTGVMKLELPLREEAVIEIVTARLNMINARFKVNFKAYKVTGKNCINCFGLESGGNKHPRVVDIEKIIYMQIVAPELPDPFDKKALKRLDYILEVRRKRREENIYIPIPVTREEHPLHNKEIFEALKKDLPHIGFVYFGTTGEEKVLIISEDEDKLVVLIYEFFLMLKGKQRK